jgi:hypothetical protein
MRVEIAVWIMAGSLFVLAVCAAAYVILRISDEMRFRHALDGIESQENGAIVLPRRQIKKGRQGRTDNYRRIRAQEWLDGRIGGVKK